MTSSLDDQAVREWIKGQRAAGERLEAERVSFLRSLTPERSLQIYLALRSLMPEEAPKQPAPLLLSMRKALARLESTRER